jgi:hypothetical protein
MWQPGRQENSSPSHIRIRKGAAPLRLFLLPVESVLIEINCLAVEAHCQDDQCGFVPHPIPPLPESGLIFADHESFEEQGLNEFRIFLSHTGAKIPD